MCIYPVHDQIENETNFIPVKFKYENVNLFFSLRISIR